jgi:spermidine/putrescine transport system substrate-binding protein
MPAKMSLETAGRRLGRAVSVQTVASNELLESRLASPGGFDLIFPSDYLVERLRARGHLLALAHERVPLERLAGWSLAAVHDPGARLSVPFAYGTTGYLSTVPGARSWSALFDPPPGTRVGMLEEVREVVGAALIATGHGPNEVAPSALRAAAELLAEQRPRVARFNSDDFITPVVSNAVRMHHAWSGPSAQAVRLHRGLRYVVPDEGAILWITTAAIPSNAEDPAGSTALLAELMDPELAAQTTELHGFATPNEPARRLLSRDLRVDGVLFPPAETLARCYALRDLGQNEARLAATWPGP